MNNILGCVSWFWSKFMQLFRQRAPYINDPSHELVQVSDNTFRNEDGLQDKLNKTQNFNDDSFIIKDPKIEFNDEIENKADFQDISQRSTDTSDHVFLRQFIDLIPAVDVDDIDQIKEIGDKSVTSFIQIVQSLEGYEQLENNNDEFSFWIKYVETPEKFQISIMRYTYTLNTTLDNYLAFMADIDLQAKLDNSIDCYENVWKQDEYGILYLRYKKILFMDPRDFLFIKKTDRKEDMAIEISKSINYDYVPKNAASKSTTRALLLLTGNYVRQIDDNKLEITCYAESNMKLKLKPVMTKAASKNEIKKIIKKYRDHFNQN